MVVYKKSIKSSSPLSQKRIMDSTPYSVWEMRRFLMIGISDFTPQALLQLVESDLGVSSSQFQVLIYDLLFTYCSRFFNHTPRWMTNGRQNPIRTMMEWHLRWEGFHSDEPWHDSAGRPISYFMNIQYKDRLDEMYQQFIV